ncbi:methyltransferase domain-containing protein [Marinobacterium aestuariivivens]|uniref:Methyltransferase domain-containing protein n=1 Tax=Marinobacterium aestuariivivens TaxID=1698799 RepID=A0ABW1ZYU9_9GAMM
MQSVRDKWNRRYRARGAEPPAVPAFVPELAPRLRPGRLLDVGAGDGAASLWLAARGFDVTAVDIAGEGLSRLERFADAQGLRLGTACVDLGETGCLESLGAFDSILVCRYKPEAGLWPQLAAALVPGGILALVTFNLEHHRRSGFSERFCLAPRELVDIEPRLELIGYSTLECDGDCLDRYIFRRK